MNVKITMRCLAILSQRPAKIQMAVISAFVYRALEKKAAHVKVRVFHVDGVYATFLCKMTTQSNLLLNILNQFTTNTLSSLRFISDHIWCKLLYGSLNSSKSAKSNLG